MAENNSTREIFTEAEYLLEMLRGYRNSQILIACTELGVFEALAGGGKSARELGAILSLDPAPLQRLLNAAVALDLLRKEGESYSNAPAAAACLAQDGTGYLGHLFRRESAFYDRWGRLSEAVQTGQRPEPNRAMEDRNNWVRDFEYALYDLARLYGPAVAKALDLAPERSWRVLDLGGGHGGYSLALAQRYPRLEATVFDLPPVIEVAREIVGAAEGAGRVKLRAGDFLVDDLGEGYDLVLLFGVLISEPSDRRVALLRRIREALAPGGWLVFRESVVEDDGTGSVEAVLFDLQMLLSTKAGGALKRSTLISELREAGFGAIEVRAVPAPGAAPLWLTQPSSIAGLG